MRAAEPLPFPLVKRGGRWQFDAKAGAQEWQDRRIGQNELSAIQVALAYVCLTLSVRRVPGFEAATLLLLEPVFNPLWTWFMRGERPGAGDGA